MSFALPTEIEIDGYSYDVIPLRRVIHLGRELDCLVCHRTRQAFISLAAPAFVQAAALEQARSETRLLLLTGGPVPSVS